MAKIERTKNASRNIVYGVTLKAYQIIMPFIIRTAMIYLMGVQYLGLNSLFTSILQILNLAELGVGTAMVYSMYQPIAEDDSITICALMKLYRTYYRVIGAVIAIMGLILMPFVPKLITGDVPGDINIYILYLLNLGSTVLSYWLFAYKNSILQAYQRIDVISKVELGTNTFQYLGQLLVLWLFHDYYLYVIVMFLSQALTNIVTALYANKLYPKFKPLGEIEIKKKKEINRRIKDLFTSKIGFVVVNFADTIVISAFLGLTSLAIYQNYYFIINSITCFIFIINNSICAGVGNSLLTESLDKNYRDYEKFNFILFWILCICVSCFVGLIQPFMKLWVGKDLMLSDGMVFLFCMYFLCNVIERSWSCFKEAAGVWHNDRFRPLIYGIANLIVNLLLVRYIGLYGIVLSTIVSCLFISIPWIAHDTFKLIYKRSIVGFLKQILGYIVIIIISAVCNYYICDMIKRESFIWFIVKCIISVLIPNVLYLIINLKSDLMKDSVKLVKKMIPSKK